MRRKSRELTLQVLFQREFAPQLTETEALSYLAEQAGSPEEVRTYALHLIKGVVEHCKPIDQLIRSHSRNWSVERMGLVDLNILRVAVYEIRFDQQVPPHAAINEAIEVAKKYSTQEAAGFINGILDAIYNNMTG